MRDFIANRIKEVPKSGIRDFFELTIGMDDIISLGVGEPDFATPWHIREASIYALEIGKTMYTSNYGLLKLRNLIAEHVFDKTGVEYDPKSEILITVGVSEAMDLALRSIINPGDEILYHEPAYVSYSPLIYLAGGKPVAIQTRFEDDFKLIPEAIEEKLTKASKAIVINYPNNPTGAVMKKKEMEAIAELATRHDLFVISDEIYDELTYNGGHFSILSVPDMKDRVLYLNGFSKAYAMTGYRIGYACGPKPIIDAMLKIHQYSMLCASIIAQEAAVEAIMHGEKEMLVMKESYRQRRNIIYKGFKDIGFDVFLPEGAFYIFPSIKGSGLSSMDFAIRLLKEKKVAVVPGSAFGKSGEGFIRCCYATSMPDIKMALTKIKEFVEEL